MERQLISSRYFTSESRALLAYLNRRCVGGSLGARDELVTVKDEMGSSEARAGAGTKAVTGFHRKTTNGAQARQCRQGRNSGGKSESKHIVTRTEEE